MRVALQALDGNALAVQRWGQGPAIVALHGFTGTSATWEPLAETLGPGYELVGIDIIGHGESDAPGDVGLYTMARFVSALSELLDRLGLERVCWLGYSMGARIALRAALDLPERTWGLVLESGTPGLPSETERAERVAADEALAQRIEAEGIERFVDYWETLPLWAGDWRISDAQRQRLRESRLAQRPLGLANSLRGMGTGAQEPLHDRLGEIRVPALIMAGEEDTKFRDIAGDVAKAITVSRLVVVPEAGHAVHLEQPERFTELVTEFLDSVPADGC
ncbi:MAG: 2-succinyl-6-hydroxy-2,4-cyclohexadiene-1-carboxylate synthase [Dehalococcoidia bacterium]